VGLFLLALVAYLLRRLPSALPQTVTAVLLAAWVLGGSIIAWRIIFAIALVILICWILAAEYERKKADKTETAERASEGERRLNAEADARTIASERRIKEQLVLITGEAAKGKPDLVVAVIRFTDELWNLIYKRHATVDGAIREIGKIPTLDNLTPDEDRIVRRIERDADLETLYKFSQSFVPAAQNLAAKMRDFGVVDARLEPLLTASPQEWVNIEDVSVVFEDMAKRLIQPMGAID
jgi:hypothetical protein